MGKKSSTPANKVEATLELKWPDVTTAEPEPAVTLVNDDLLVIDDLFSRQRLKAWRTFLSTLPMVAPEPGPPKPGFAARQNSRLSIQDGAFAELLWTQSGLKALCERQSVITHDGRKRVLGLNPNIRVYAYNPSDHFGAHFDDDFYDPVTRRRTEWTLLIYLTGEEDGVTGECANSIAEFRPGSRKKSANKPIPLPGGETVFYPNASRKANGEPLSVSLRAGRAVLHRHGQSCMLHEGVSDCAAVQTRGPV